MMLLKRPPFNGNTETDIMQAILDEDVPFQGTKTHTQAGTGASLAPNAKRPLGLS
jgi:hypothetical protein